MKITGIERKKIIEALYLASEWELQVEESWKNCNGKEAYQARRRSAVFMRLRWKLIAKGKEHKNVNPV